uniref:Photosystem I assembly protein Ycf4 n=1 Tax=Passiflora lutea TaxID=330177 RepID=A0A4Y5QEE3_9ROSI|nr:photosystem I assembly protein Ycf4 [Passiflora lutea]YP_009670684.1 photosystem I assembly protein Ycf4 [Passiflora lutea]QCX29916.1 photosystem I assembly protein Ycf4 [Passiflora lutea]QCX29917.1 photosystem I assembly protein Ycf4 [Passiflora lutea]
MSFNQFKDSDKESVLIEDFRGSRTKRNFLCAFILFVSSLGFLVLGIFSCRGKNLILSFWSKQIIFYPQGIPQGILILVGGIAGLFISCFLWCQIFYNVGGGYDLFDKKRDIMYRFRWIFPRNNEHYYYESCKFPVKDIELILIKLNFYSKHVLYWETEDSILWFYQTFDRKEIEQKGTRLAAFLDVPLKIIDFWESTEEE